MNNPIRQQRQQRGLTMSDLAAAIGVSNALVGVWERGELMPPRRRVETLGKVFRCEPAGLEADLRKFREGVQRIAVAKMDAAADTVEVA